MLPRSIDVFEVSKFITSSVEQSLNDWFESEILKGTLATDGIIGENLSIGDPATGYVLLHHVMGALEEERKGEWGYVEGGNGRLSEILRDIYLEKGGELRLNCAVDKILYDGKKPVAVRLADGEII
jgi:phytoene dehydrogenase-like protein